MGNAPDPICRLIRELRDYAEDRYTPGELTHVLDAAAAALEAKDAEIERLGVEAFQQRSRADQAREQLAHYQDSAVALADRLEETEAALKEAREGLAFYADNENWRQRGKEDGEPFTTAIRCGPVHLEARAGTYLPLALIDTGKKARALLSQDSGERS